MIGAEQDVDPAGVLTLGEHVDALFRQHIPIDRGGELIVAKGDKPAGPLGGLDGL